MMRGSGAVVVTGASGFIGTHVGRTLRERGYDVRPWSHREPERLAGLLRGVDAVVHLAGRVHVMREAESDPDAAFHAANVALSRALVEAAAAAGVRRFILASSVKAVGETSAAPWTEETVPAPVDPYGRSKLEAERVVSELAARLGVGASILRLPLVYGPGVRANFLNLLRWVDAGVPIPVPAVANRRSLAYVGNVAAAIGALLASDAAMGQTFFIRDPSDVSTLDLVRAIARALGRPSRVVPIPESALRLAGRVGDLAPGWAGLPLSSAAVARLAGSLAVDDAKLRRVVGFVPPYSLEQGLAETARWFRGSRSAESA